MGYQVQAQVRGNWLGVFDTDTAMTAAQRMNVEYVDRKFQHSVRVLDSNGFVQYEIPVRERLDAQP